MDLKQYGSVSQQLLLPEYYWTSSNVRSDFKAEEEVLQWLNKFQELSGLTWKKWKTYTEITVSPQPITCSLYSLLWVELLNKLVVSEKGMSVKHACLSIRPCLDSSQISLTSELIQCLRRVLIQLDFIYIVLLTSDIVTKQ